MVDDENMPAVSPATWQQGFTTGAHAPACACPFPRRTREAMSWLLGWEKGIQQLLGQRRSSEQAALVTLFTLHARTGQAAQRF